MPQLKPPPIDRTFFVGVDLGQRGSHTAFVVLERFDEQPEFTAMLRGQGIQRRYLVRQAERVSLGTPLLRSRRPPQKHDRTNQPTTTLHPRSRRIRRRNPRRRVHAKRTRMPRCAYNDHLWSSRRSRRKRPPGSPWLGESQGRSPCILFLSGSGYKREAREQSNRIPHIAPSPRAFACVVSQGTTRLRKSPMSATASAMPMTKVAKRERSITLKRARGELMYAGIERSDFTLIGVIEAADFGADERGDSTLRVSAGKPKERPVRRDLPQRRPSASRVSAVVSLT